MALYDFGGYATKNNLKCSDGRVIRQNAFEGNDGQTVPLVWQHQRNTPDNVLGHALLENRDDGVYCYCKFNGTDSAQQAKALVEHGDIKSLSIYANQLQQQGSSVLHGMIREVSLVLAGANPGALIDNFCIEHSDGSYETVEEEAVIYTGLDISTNVEHAEKNQNEGGNSDSDDETVEDVFNSMTDKQKQVVYFMVGQALEESASEDEDEDEVEQSDYDEDDEESLEHNSDKGENFMKKNVFDAQDTPEVTITHADVETIFANARKYGSLKAATREYIQENYLKHSITGQTDAGVSDNKFPEDILFPEAKAVTATPEMIMRQQDWVSVVWNGTRKSPFSRIKSWAADITADEARARGYIKGKKKIEEVITMLKRSTTPQTVYKLQKMDRDDIIDITSFDVVAFLKAEMRLMLNEELSRAVLIGDGRTPGDESHISHEHIRPIWTDDDLYTIKYPIAFGADDTDDEKADKFITAVHRARKEYRGSGAPTMFLDTDTLTTLLLAKDKIGRRLYTTTTELASALRVSKIVEVPLMEGQKRDARPGVDSENGKEYTLMALIVNLSDYTIGADRGGAVSMFDDFDIDYNKYSYLIETRCSGALTKPYSAIAIEVESAAG